MWEFVRVIAWAILSGFLVVRVTPVGEWIGLRAPELQQDQPRFGRLLTLDGSLAFPSLSSPVFHRVEPADITGEWPILASEAYVGCISKVEMFTTIIVVNGRPYGLNGTTMSWANADGLVLEIDGEAVKVSGEAQPEWWAKGTSTPRKYIGPIFDFAEARGCLVPEEVRASRKKH